MSKSVREILAPLDPFWDRIVRRPLTEDDVQTLEQQVGLPVPPPLRDCLLSVGLPRDITAGEDSPIEVFEWPEEMAREHRFICELLGVPHSELFPFGHDGAGDIYALGGPSEEGWPIHYVDHETREVSVQGEFLAWLEETVSRTLETIDERTPVSIDEQTPRGDRVRAVHFGFSGTSFADIMRLLATVGTVRDLDGRWRNREGWPWDVRQVRRRIELDGEVLVVSRLDYYLWSSPSIKLDMREPVKRPPGKSRIRQLEELFSAHCPDYTFLDYASFEVSPGSEASRWTELPPERWIDRMIRRFRS
jgi:hypothetical protein